MQKLTEVQKKAEFTGILKGIGLIIFISLVSNLLAMDCKAQSSYSAYQQSTQEINRQQHQQEVMRQQRQILQQQYIQQQQLEQMRRDAEFRFNQSNRNLNSYNSNQILGY